MRASSVISLFVLGVLAGCGGGGGGQGNGGVSVSINPSSLTLGLAASRTFTAIVNGGSSPAVNWSVQEGASGGSITTNGTYLAPSIAGIYHVVATSQEDPTKSAIATITVPVEVSISPSTVTITIGDTVPFTATVLGSANRAVTWTVQGGAPGGAISLAGLYTPPNAAGTFHVVATSQADATRSASATIIVQTGGGSVIVH